MNGSDLIVLAGALVAQRALGDAEARYRSAISRAYYGAFHLTVAFLAEFNVRIPGNATGHQRAYECLFGTNVDLAKEAARSLNDLRGERISADYKLNVRGLDSQPNAREKVELAITIRQLLEQCRIEPVRSAIVAGMARQTQ
jgi:uncharacterized protein (UPF0332 family)